MSTQPCRKPNLGDVMILVVASAIALAITRQVGEPPSYFADAPGHLRLAFAIEKWADPWLVAMAWAAMAIRLRRPRPSLRRLWRQPGAIAMLMTVVASLYVGILALARTLKLAFFGADPRIVVDGGPVVYLGMVVQEGGTLIVGAWLALALTRRLRREQGWIDGFGYALGMVWIVANVTLSAYSLILS